MGKLMHRSLDAGTNHKLLHRHAEDTAKKALELALGKPGMPGDFRKHQSFAKMIADKIGGFAHHAEGAQHFASCLQELNRPDETNHLASRIVQRILVGDRPIAKTIFVHSHFHAVPERFAVLDHPLIVGNEFVRHFGRQIIMIRETDELVFGEESKMGDALAAEGHQATLGVFHKVADIRQMIECSEQLSGVDLIAKKPIAQTQAGRQGKRGGFGHSLDLLAGTIGFGRPLPQVRT